MRMFPRAAWIGEIDFSNGGQWRARSGAETQDGNWFFLAGDENKVACDANRGDPAREPSGERGSGSIGNAIVIRVHETNQPAIRTKIVRTVRDRGQDGTVRQPVHAEHIIDAGGKGRHAELRWIDARTLNCERNLRV